MCDVRFDHSKASPPQPIHPGGSGQCAWRFSEELQVKPVKHIIKAMSWSNWRGEQMAAGNKSLRGTQLRNRLRDLRGHSSRGRTKDTQQVNSGKIYCKVPIMEWQQSCEKKKKKKENPTRELNLRREGKQAPRGHNYGAVSAVAGCANAGAAMGAVQPSQHTPIAPSTHCHLLQ